ncbi:MAG: hypothetical protein JWP21_764 [Tardiphaga sp.]|nr:hypothetical protein [Tardiphaga sp.]
MNDVIRELARRSTEKRSRSVPDELRAGIVHRADYAASESNMNATSQAAATLRTASRNASLSRMPS